MARDPVLTCCSHLFCWCCFYQMSYVDSSAKECPVCEGEVTDSSVTPIYGNGRNEPVLKLENGVKIPPRLQARRVESVRQQRVIRGISHIPALRRIKIGLGNTIFKELTVCFPVRKPIHHCYMVRKLVAVAATAPASSLG
ncbi:putative transcription factor C2H2 family [Helianthus annuus]|nr:putative transcription factor C2H2 family [Helianthus annuus]